MQRTNSIYNAFDEMFEFMNHNSSTYSKTDIRQVESGYSLDVLLPGFTKEEISIKAEGEELILEASTERSLPKFLNKKVRKTYQIDQLDADTIEAKLECGILTITFTTISKKNARSISIL